MSLLSFNASFVRRLYHKIGGRLRSNPNNRPDRERGDAMLPNEGMSIAVETALNSRCTSDYDDDPRNFHWGMFDKNKKLTPDQIQQVLSMAKIPRFTNGAIEIKSETNTMTFLIDSRLSALQRDGALVESGMQHQAVGLVCAALGIGYVFSSLGVEGKAISADQFATVRIQLGAMQPSYNGAYWSTAAPAEIKPWKSGTLPDPVRQGNKPLIAALARLKTHTDAGKNPSLDDLGQLLWAARGRTPHYHLSSPWGMTIPTYHGDEGISEVFVISDGKVSKYINWKNNRPTHSLEVVGEFRDDAGYLPAHQQKSGNSIIVLNRNLSEGRAYWEIGYQLLNLMLQAQSLELHYAALLLEEHQKIPFQAAGIKDPVAAISL